MKKAQQAGGKNDAMVESLCGALALLMETEYELVGHLHEKVPNDRKLNPDDPDVSDELALIQLTLARTCGFCLEAILGGSAKPDKGKRQIAYLYGLWMQKCTLRRKVIERGHKAVLDINRYIAMDVDIF